MVEGDGPALPRSHGSPAALRADEAVLGAGRADLLVVGEWTERAGGLHDSFTELRWIGLKLRQIKAFKVTILMQIQDESESLTGESTGD